MAGPHPGKIRVRALGLKILPPLPKRVTFLNNSGNKKSGSDPKRKWTSTRPTQIAQNG